MDAFDFACDLVIFLFLQIWLPQNQIVATTLLGGASKSLKCGLRASFGYSFGGSLGSLGDPRGGRAASKSSRCGDLAFLGRAQIAHVCAEGVLWVTFWVPAGPS